MGGILASTGFSKWEKYFSTCDVPTVLNSKKQYIKIYDDKMKNIDTVQSGQIVTVLHTTNYNSMYRIEYSDRLGYVSGDYVRKPIQKSGSTENLGIKTADLIDLGDNQTIQYQNKDILIKHFKSPKILYESVMSGLSDNHNITPDILNSVSAIFNSSGTFTWNISKNSDKNELGKYIGELLYPYIYSRNKNCSFGFPISLNFSGIDSFILADQIIPISNKYGKGAASSFMSNIVAKADLNSLEHSVFRNICLLKGTAKEVLFEYSSKYVFPDNPELFSDIVNNTIGDKTQKTLNHIRTTCDNPNIINALPYSVAPYLCYRMMWDLKACPISMNQINTIISKNNYTQVSLNTIKWNSGIIEYQIKNTSDYKLKLEPTKSTMSDIHCKHGTLCYRLC